MSTRTAFTVKKLEVEIDPAQPLAAGTSIAHALVMPFAHACEAEMPEHLDRVHLWTGLFAATLGMMTAAIGPDDAETVYQGLRGAFDEARRIDAATVQASTGVH